MRAVKLARNSRVALFALPFALVANFIISPLALADHSSGVTFFERTGGVSLIGQGYGGTNSVLGSVMPNRQGYNTYQGGGAVGEIALGIYGRTTTNRERKQALYDYLKSRYDGGNTNYTDLSVANWERMGAALIAHQMLGRQNWGPEARVVTTAEWTDLYNRLVLNDKVTMVSGSHNHNLNSAGVVANGKFDAIRWQFYDAPENAQKHAWVFRVEGVAEPVYALEIICANPLGQIPGLPTVEYSLVPRITSIKTPDTNGSEVTSIQAGSQLSVQRDVRNQGPDNSLPTRWTLTRFIYSPGNAPTSAQREGHTSQNEACNANFPSTGDCQVVRNPARETFQAGQQKDADSYLYPVPSGLTSGTRVCFVTSVSTPTHAASPLWRHSGMRCVNVTGSPTQTQFDLTPEIDPDGRENGSAIEPGDSITVGHSVTNEGQDVSGQTIWQLTRMVYTPNTAPSDEDKRRSDSENNPCARLAIAPAECAVVPGQSTTTVFNPGAPRVFDPMYTESIPEDAPVGTRICFVSSVSRPTPNSSPASTWRHSAMWCVMVGKKPKMQVWGGDVRSGGKINTSTSGFASRTFGSWGEYGVLSMRDNSGFASGAMLNGGHPMPGQSLWSRLTFANTGSATECMFGCYNFSLSDSPLVERSFVAQFKDVAPATMSGSLNLNSLASSRTEYRATNITLTDTTISRGKTIIIVADETVTIAGDIRYEDGSDYTNMQDLPQVVIRAPVINIQGDVRRVDAWLLAVGDGSTGVLNTCSYDNGNPIALSDSLTAGTCNNQLIVNGPVVADTVHLRRTGGSENHIDGRGEPAEIFNLRADAYMWGNAYGIGAGHIQTVHLREVSPRF